MLMRDVDNADHILAAVRRGEKLSCRGELTLMFAKQSNADLPLLGGD